MLLIFAIYWLLTLVGALGVHPVLFKRYDKVLDISLAKVKGLPREDEETIINAFKTAFNTELEEENNPEYLKAISDEQMIALLGKIYSICSPHTDHLCIRLGVVVLEHLTHSFMRVKLRLKALSMGSTLLPDKTKTLLLSTFRLYLDSEAHQQELMNSFGQKAGICATIFDDKQNSDEILEKINDKYISSTWRNHEFTILPTSRRGQQPVKGLEQLLDKWPPSIDASLLHFLIEIHLDYVQADSRVGPTWAIIKGTDKLQRLPLTSNVHFYIVTNALDSDYKSLLVIDGRYNHPPRTLHYDSSPDGRNHVAAAEVITELGLPPNTLEEVNMAREPKGEFRPQFTALYTYWTFTQFTRGLPVTENPVLPILKKSMIAECFTGVPLLRDKIPKYCVQDSINHLQDAIAASSKHLKEISDL